MASQKLSADMQMEDAVASFSEGLKGFISASLASVNAATVLQKDSKVLSELLAREMLKVRDERLQLEAHQSAALSPAAGLSPDQPVSRPDSARARAFERELGVLRLGGNGPQIWEPFGEAAGNAFNPVNVFAPLRADGPDAQNAEFMRADGPEAAYYEDLNNAVRIGLRNYTVLPAHPRHSTKPSHSMCNQTVVLPDGWEVLSTDMEGCEQVVQMLTEDGWGTLRLCVRDADTNGFVSYGTPLRHFGLPGERLSDNTDVVVADPENPRVFVFNSSKVSGRLVIRSDRLWHGRR